MAGSGNQAGHLSVDEVARMYRVGRRTVFRLIARHNVPRVRVPGHRQTYISAADAEAIFRPVSVRSMHRG